MKKRIVMLFLALLLLLILGGILFMLYGENKEKQNEPPRKPIAPSSSEIRAMWVNYNEISMAKESGGAKESFLRKSEEIVENLCTSGINRVIIHVRPFCDALYPSSLFPFSQYLTGTQGKTVPYDPLEIFIETARKKGISVEAWINPYRVSLSVDWDSLSEKNPAKQWHESGEDEHLLICDKGIYLNPSSEKARALILNGVREIVEHYDVDAIHMDDYFYPTDDPAIDAAAFSAYQNAGGKLSLADWRRQNVNDLVSSMYAAIKAIRPSVLLTISPCGNIEHNREKLFADVELWGRESGYCDILMPQLYYGFQNTHKPFEKTAADWAKLVSNPNVKLCYALGAYKCGKEDNYAGTGKNEWKENSDILSRQIEFCRTLPKYDGVAFYGYTNIYLVKDNENAQKEWKNLKNMLQ